MDLTVHRYEKSKDSKATIGKLLIDGTEFCYTLEDQVRPDGVKVYGQTAIPAGVYEVSIRYSPHFGRNMIHVEDVPKFSGILFHWGNDDLDTDGCVLVGEIHAAGTNFIGNSKLAHQKLWDAVVSRLTEHITVKVENSF